MRELSVPSSKQTMSAEKITANFVKSSGVYSVNVLLPENLLHARSFTFKSAILTC